MPSVTGDTKSSRIIQVLDKIGRQVDAKEYGLPIHSNYYEEMRNAVDKILNEEEDNLAGKKKPKKKGSKKGC